MRKSHLLALLAGLGALTCGATAQASVETVAPARSDPDSNCAQPQEHDPFAVWRQGDPVARFAGSGTVRYEVFGHGIDLSPDAKTSGITGAWAKRVDGHGGPVNAAHGCGNIGSVVIDLHLPAVSSANSGTLHIGSETVPIRAVPLVVSELDWEQQNLTDGVQLTQAEMQARDAVILQDAVNRCQQGLLAGDTICRIGGYFLADTLNQACTAFINMGATCDTRSSFPARLRGSDFRNTIGNCGDIDGLGSARTGLNPRVLTLTLPQNRTGHVATCFGRPVIAGYTYEGSGAIDDTFPLIEKDVSLTQTGTGPALARLAYSEEHAINGRFSQFNLPVTVMTDLVGIYTWEIALNPGSTSSALRLIVQSTPGYGVKALASAVYSPNVGRLNSSHRLIVTPYQATRAGQVFHYQIDDSAAGRACFTSRSGDMTAPVGQASFDVPLTIAENAACYGKVFTATVIPTGVPASDPRFGKTVTFSLPPLTQLIVPTTVKPDLKVNGIN